MASLSYTHSKDAVPVAVLVGPNNVRKSVLYADNDYEPAAHAKDSYGVDDNKTRCVTAPTGERFEPVVNGREGKRDIVAIIGPSGSGKSHVIKEIAENYRRMYPSRPRFLISSLDADETLDGLNLTRVDDELLSAEPPTDVYAWRESLVIIDDVEGFPKQKRDVVQALQDLIATQGRHSETSLLRAQHVMDDRVVNRHILHECTSFIVYPAHSGTIVPMLKKFGGLTRAQAESVASLRTRWVQVHHTAPKFTLTSHACTIL